MKTIARRDIEWQWPDDDEKLLAVFDWVDDIQAALPHCTRQRTVIQAGGACGVWPYFLAEHFHRVVTLEPDAINYDCLFANAGRLPNVWTLPFGLWDSNATATLQRPDSEEGNAGAWYASPDRHGDVNLTTIDELDERPDLIMLDIEGGEHRALLGAERTLTKHHPVVMIEEKPLPQTPDYTKARQYLQRMGYTQVARAHNDVVFKVVA